MTEVHLYTDQTQRGSVPIERQSLGEVRDACDALMAAGMPFDADFRLINIDTSEDRVAGRWEVGECRAGNCTADTVRYLTTSDAEDVGFCADHTWADVDTEDGE